MVLSALKMKLYDIGIQIKATELSVIEQYGETAFFVRRMPAIVGLEACLA